MQYTFDNLFYEDIREALHKVVEHSINNYSKAPQEIKTEDLVEGVDFTIISSQIHKTNYHANRKRPQTISY